MKYVIENKKVFYAGLVYFLCILLFVCLRILWGTGIFGGIDPILNDLLFSVIIQILILTLLPFFLYKALTKQTVRQVASSFFFKKIDFKTVVLSILTGILVYILIVFVSSFWTTLLALFGYSGGGSSTETSSLPVWLAFLLTIVSTSLLPGFGEEIAHRGMTLSTAKPNGITRAILLSALMFALAHLNIAQTGYAFVVGLILGCVTLITRSIFPAMIIHATSNFCSIYLSYAGANGWFLGDLLQNFSDLVASNWTAGLILGFLLLSVVFVLLMVLFVQFFTRARQQRFDAFCNKLYEDTRGTPMEKQINFDDKFYMFTLFSQAVAQDLKQKLDNGDITTKQLEAEANRTPLFSMLNSEFDTFKKPRKLDYLFYYITIFLGATVTIMTMIWGIL